MKGKTSWAGLAGARSCLSTQGSSQNSCKARDPWDDSKPIYILPTPKYCPGRAHTPLITHTLELPSVFLNSSASRRLRWDPDLPTATWGNKVSSRHRKTRYINAVCINASRLHSVYHAGPALGSIEKGKKRRKRSISYTDP